MQEYWIFSTISDHLHDLSMSSNAPIRGLKEIKADAGKNMHNSSLVLTRGEDGF